jgi:hypothetical protein
MVLEVLIDEDFKCSGSIMDVDVAVAVMLLLLWVSAVFVGGCLL